MKVKRKKIKRVRRKSKEKRPLRKKPINQKKIFDKKRKPGYYWVQVENPSGNKRWIIARWWNSLNFFDTMGTIREIGSKDKIVRVDENQIKRKKLIKRK